MIKTTLIYIERGDEYLMLHRVSKQNDINKDKWIGVGGKLEQGESVRDCAAREMREETGLKAIKLNYRGMVYFINGLYESEEMHLFTCREYEGEIITCDEGRLEWVKKSDITKLNIWEGDKIFLKKLAEDAPFFKLKLVYHGDELREYGFI